MADPPSETQCRVGAGEPSIATHSNASRDDIPQCMAVMYDYVHDCDSLRPGVLDGLDCQEFESQLDLLCRTMEPVDWPNLFAWMEGTASIPRRCFLLTFDDGLADHASYVVPILERRGLRGVFFSPGCVLASIQLLPAHAIHILISALGSEKFAELVYDELESTSFNKAWRATLDESVIDSMYHYECPIRALLNYVLTVAVPIDVRSQIIRKLFERHVGSMKRWAREWYMSWENLSQLQAMGHTIGGHGFSHEPLMRLSKQQRISDINKSAAILNEGLGVGRRPFSFPYGSFDESASRACQRAGFVQAFTTQKAWIDSGSSKHAMPRFDTIDVDKALQEELLASPGK